VLRCEAPTAQLRLASPPAHPTLSTSRGSELIGRSKVSLDGLTEREVHSLTLPLTGSNSGSLAVELAVCPGDVDSPQVMALLSQMTRTVLRPDRFRVSVSGLLGARLRCRFLHCLLRSTPAS